MQFTQFGVAFEVMHAFTLDGQINYAKSCGSLYPLRPFLIFLPLVTALKAALGWIVFFFTWPLLLQESCPGPEICVEVLISWLHFIEFTDLPVAFKLICLYWLLILSHPFHPMSVETDRQTGALGKRHQNNQTTVFICSICQMALSWKPNDLCNATELLCHYFISSTKNTFVPTLDQGTRWQNTWTALYCNPEGSS